ncbi:MAG: hypothetical protein IIZ78_02875 [Clostridiales bacterium]|nr:hypothetical protein [Clostridiales bacterium]
MAVAPTGAIYKALKFDNTSSRNYGVYITGQAVFNAPQRDVEMITIPGRNGTFALDNGRFENVEVTYPAGIFADNEEDFAQAISDFRNFLCSKRGYCRLEDDYNPDEYRMAIYKSGLEVTPAQLKAGEFEITFDCKPQRWLTSGETKTSVSSGSTVSNPTLFDASPLIEVEGYGNLNFNGYTISIENAVMGEVLLANSKTFSSNYIEMIFNKLSYETGDTITMNAGTIEWSMRIINGYGYWGYDEPTTTDSATGFHSSGHSAGFKKMYMATTVPSITFSAGTSKTVTNTATSTFKVGQTYDTRADITATCTQTITYTPNYSSTQSKVSVQYALSYSVSDRLDYGFVGASSKTGDITVNSTQSLLGHPTYIDCDLGEAYKITSGVYVSLNSKINLGSKLPTLASGSNTVTYDNTITSVRITPRWWKV